MFETITISTVIAMNIGVVELLKKMFDDHRYIPALSIITGIFLVGLFSFLPESHIAFPQTILYGIMVGLTSIGVYSGTKNTLGKAIK